MAELQEGLTAAAPLKSLDHEHQQLRGAGPTRYEEALEILAKSQQAELTKLRQKDRKTADYLAGHAEYVRTKIGHGSTETQAVVEEIFRNLGTLFPEAVAR